MTAASMPDAPAEPTVGSTIRAMRRAVKRGHGAGADTLKAWTTTLLQQLYGKQKALAWEVRENGIWIRIYTAAELDQAVLKRKTVRGLYGHPKPDTAKDHRWGPGAGPCLDCKCPFDWPTTECKPEPPPKPPEFNHAAYQEPLRVLHDLATSRLPLSYREARYWKEQTTFLLERDAPAKAGARP